MCGINVVGGWGGGGYIYRDSLLTPFCTCGLPFKTSSFMNGNEKITDVRFLDIARSWFYAL